MPDIISDEMWDKVNQQVTGTDRDIAARKPCHRVEGSANDETHTVKCACGVEITAPTIGMADAVFAAHRRAALNQSARDELLREADIHLDRIATISGNLPWVAEVTELRSLITAQLSTGGEHG